MNAHEVSDMFGAAINWLRNDYLYGETRFNVALRRYISPGILIFIFSLTLTTLLDWSWLKWWYVFALLACAWIWVSRRFFKKSQNELKTNPSPHEPDEVSPTVVMKKRRWRTPLVNSREVVVLPDGTNEFVVHSELRHREGWSRTVVSKDTRVQIIDNGFVDIRLLERTKRFEPIAGESEIHHFRRLDWISHGPHQLVVAVGGLAAAYWASALYGGVVTLAILAVTAGIYWWLWMKWAYEVLVITDVRMQLIFDPPLNLPGSAPSSPLARLQGINGNDQSWFANFCKCGIVSSGTAASVADKWIENGVKYVRDQHRVSNMLQELQLRGIQTSRE
jgi:hypothetical protein